MLTRIPRDEAEKIFGKPMRDIPSNLFNLHWTDYEDTNLVVNLCQGAKRILELGTYKGYTTQNIANVLQFDELVTVDLVKENVLVNDMLFQAHELLPMDESGCMINDPRVKQIKCSTEEFFKKDRGLFDAIFIDANHEKDYVLADSLNSMGVLADGGVIIWHDVYNHDNSCQKCEAEPENDGVIKALESLPISTFKIDKSWIAFYKDGYVPTN